MEWLGREGEALARLPCLRTLVVASFGGAQGEVVLRRALADLLAAAPVLHRLVLAADGEGSGLPLAHAARVVEFARERPRVEVQLCAQGRQPTPGQALLRG